MFHHGVPLRAAVGACELYLALTAIGPRLLASVLHPYGADLLATAMSAAVNGISAAATAAFGLRAAAVAATVPTALPVRLRNRWYGHCQSRDARGEE